MDRFLLVCAGGALGSGARYLVATWALATFGAGFPRGTLIVNVVGSFLLAVVMTLSLATELVPPHVRLFLGGGILGGFTTYSSFNWEAMALALDGRPGAAAAYVAVTVAGCLLAAMAGAALVHAVVG